MTAAHRSPSKQTQEEEVFYESKTTQSQEWCKWGHQCIHTTTIPTRKALMPRMFTRTRRDVKNVEILCMQVSSVQQGRINTSLATSMNTLLPYVIKGNKFLSSLGNQRSLCYKQELYMLVTSPYMATQKICLLVIRLFACKSRYSTPKLILRRFPHHLTWSQTLHLG